MLSAFGVIFFIASACSSVQGKDDQPKPDPDFVEKEGSAELIVFHVGPGGARLRLKDGPSLTLPPDAGREEGVTISLKREDAGHTPEGTAIGGSYHQAPPLKAPDRSKFSFTLPLEELPAACAGKKPELAIERQGTVGPAEGSSSPALEWGYQDAEHQDGALKAELIELRGMHLQFVCREEARP
jgi:hypothetical protein